jgi:hypothetical protein
MCKKDAQKIRRVEAVHARGRGSLHGPVSLAFVTTLPEANGKIEKLRVSLEMLLDCKSESQAAGATSIEAASLPVVVPVK